MPPYISYLVFGTVYNSDGFASANASFLVTSTTGNRKYTTDSNGLFLFDLSDIGYSSGESISVAITEEYNNEILETSFIVSGFYLNTDFTLAIRTQAYLATDYSPKSILHSVGKQPISTDNRLQVKGANVIETFYITDIARGSSIDYWGYVDKDGRWYIQEQNRSAGTYRYAKGSSDYITNWTNRGSLVYGYFYEVF